MKNTTSSGGSGGSTSSGGGGGRSFFFSNWIAPQNPIITLLKRRRDSKTQSQSEKVTPAVTLKTNNETTTTGTFFGKETQQRQQQHYHHHHQQQQQQQQQHQQQQLKQRQTSVNTSAHMNGTNNGTSDLFEKKMTTGFRPMKIEEYEPGHSSIAKREGNVEHSVYNPPICKPGELCHYTESSQSKNFRIRKKDENKNSSLDGFSNGGIYRSSTSSSSAAATTTQTTNSAAPKVQYDPRVDGANVYKSVLMGGPIPEEGLRNLIEPRKVKTLPPSSSTTSPPSATSTLTKSYSGLPVDVASLEESFDTLRSGMRRKKTREELEEEAKIRRRTVEQMIIIEKLKKLEEERKMNESRRHNDNFLPIEKSPVRLNRYDEESETVASGKTQAKFTATAMYNFRAKNARELSFRKGDLLFVRRQVDKNWFEGEKNGVVGIFPITYVKIRLPSSGSNKRESMTKGIALYDFTAHKPPELSLYKGDRVTIVGLIDENWVEGRSRNGEGIFPVNFIQLIDDDDSSRCSSTYGTPLPSRVATPSLEQKNIFPQHIQREIKLASRVASPVGSITSSYAPSIPSAPLSPYGSQDFDPQNSNFTSNWPSLEASLLNLEKSCVNQMTNQQQKQQKPAGRNPQSQQQQKTWQSDSRSSTLQHYRQELQDSEQHLHQLQHKYQQQQPLQRQYNYEADRSFSSNRSPHRDLLTRSAHPDLCGPPASPIRVATLTRSVTNPAFSESSRSLYSRSPCSNRYPSLISKDPVAVRSSTLVRDKMSKQNDAVTNEFLSRHGSTYSFSGESMSTIRENIPTSRYSMPVARDSFPTSRDYYAPRAAKDSEGDDTFSFREIKLVPRLPVDYSKPAYSVQTRTSLSGSRSMQTESGSSCNSQSTSRVATPTKNYEWYKVTHDYEPRKPDELRLAKGDLIQVGEKCKDGWWVGISQATGKLGLFPGNYVVSA